MLPDPMDYYEEFSEWLMANAEVDICNKDDLIRHIGSGTRFDEFLAYKESCSKTLLPS